MDLLIIPVQYLSNMYCTLFYCTKLKKYLQTVRNIWSSAVALSGTVASSNRLVVIWWPYELKWIFRYETKESTRLLIIQINCIHAANCLGANDRLGSACTFTLSWCWRDSSTTTLRTMNFFLRLVMNQFSVLANAHKDDMIDGKFARFIVSWRFSTLSENSWMQMRSIFPHTSLS